MVVWQETLGSRLNKGDEGELSRHALIGQAPRVGSTAILSSSCPTFNDYTFKRAR